MAELEDRLAAALERNGELMAANDTLRDALRQAEDANARLRERVAALCSRAPTCITTVGYVMDKS